MKLLDVGTKAPDFTTIDQDGRPVSLKDFKGKTVILYFYPKDDTPGCTKEACGIRDNFARFAERGAVVLGVSVDGRESHRKFVDKYHLPFTLLVDEDKKIVQSYGVWGDKGVVGRLLMGTHRVTYAIGGDGTIAGVFPKVNPEEHAEDLLRFLDARAGAKNG